MQYKLENYRHLYNTIKKHLSRHNNVPPHSLLSEMAVMTGAPVLVIGHLLQKMGYSSPELRGAVMRLESFYKAKVDIGGQDE